MITGWYMNIYLETYINHKNPKCDNRIEILVHFSVMDRGFVFSLIRTYMKDVATKILQAGSVSHDSVELWHLQVTKKEY